MAVVGALQHTPIERLKKSMSLINEKDHVLLKSICEFTCPSRNYFTYRNVQRNVNGFCIPYIGLYLRDLIHTNDHQSTFTLHGGIVNFTKMYDISCSSK